MAHIWAFRVASREVPRSFVSATIHHFRIVPPKRVGTHIVARAFRVAGKTPMIPAPFVRDARVFATCVPRNEGRHLRAPVGSGIQFSQTETKPRGRSESSWDW